MFRLSIGFVAGLVAGILVLVSIHTWGTPAVMDETGKWLRKASGTERSFTEKAINRVEELGDTLKGEKSTSKEVRETEKDLEKLAREAYKEAKKSLKQASEVILEKLEEGADNVEKEVDKKKKD